APLLHDPLAVPYAAVRPGGDPPPAAGGGVSCWVHRVRGGYLGLLWRGPPSGRVVLYILSPFPAEIDVVRGQRVAAGELDVVAQTERPLLAVWRHLPFFGQRRHVRGQLVGTLLGDERVIGVEDDECRGKLELAVRIERLHVRLIEVDDQ